MRHVLEPVSCFTDSQHSFGEPRFILRVNCATGVSVGPFVWGLAKVTQCCNLVVCLQSLIVRDTVRECLEKDPAERTEDDIEVLLEFMQHLPVGGHPPPCVTLL